MNCRTLRILGEAMLVGLMLVLGWGSAGCGAARREAEVLRADRKPASDSGLGSVALAVEEEGAQRLSSEDRWRAYATMKAPTESGAEPEAPTSALEFQEFMVLPVLYGTDRRPERTLESWRALREAHGSDIPYFGSGLDNGYQLGVCWVTVPGGHRVGRVERPRRSRLEFREDLSKHFTIFNLEPLPADEFIARINRSLDPDRDRHAFIFIHGFNVEFHEAAMRAAQLAYDWRFPGPTILFSWASQGGASPEDYVIDGETAMGSSARHFERFLIEVMGLTGTTNLHLIAHSMGNRVMTLALSRAPESLRRQINQVVFAAPDVRTDVFIDNFPLVRRIARRTTLYGSSRDRALTLARSLQNDYPRAGLGGGDLVLLPGLESIDASALNTDMLGHSYLTDAREMLSDLRRLIMEGATPGARGLLRFNRGGIDFWMISGRGVGEPRGP